MARLVSLTALTMLLVFLGITFYRVVAPFLLPLFLAGVMAVICQPIYHSLVKKTGGRVRIAAGLTTFGVLIVGLVPLSLVILASVELYALARNKIMSDDWKTNVTRVRQELQIDHLAKRLLPYLVREDMSEESANTEIPSVPTSDVGEKQTTDEMQGPEAEIEAQRRAEEAGRRHVDQLQADLEQRLKSAMQSITQRTIGFAGAAAASVPGAAVDILGTFVVGIVAGMMFIIALYYFLADGPSFLVACEQLVPVHVTYQRELRERFGTVVRAVASSTLLAAVTQGFLCAIALWFTGFGHFMLFFVMGTLAAMIPVVGTVPIWGPFVIVLAVQRDWGSALFLAAMGTVVIGTADNLIRTFVLQSNAKLHPLLAFVSVLGGVQVMGLWGIFIGPIVASFLHALVTIFNTELKEFSKEKFSGVLEGEVPASDLVGTWSATASLDGANPSIAPPASAETHPQKRADGGTKPAPAGKHSKRRRR